MSAGTVTALPELTISTAVTTWTLDPVALAVAVLLSVLYAAGVIRLLARGERWSVPRALAFATLGVGVLVIATMSSLTVYSRVLFWPAAVRNILLDLLVPLGIALGDPLRLADRALPPRAAARLERGWRSFPVRLLTFPFVSSAMVLASEMSIYFTHYFRDALAHEGILQLMDLQLFLTGCLFVLPIVTGEEMLPRWCTHPVRALLVFLDGLFDSVPGIVVLFSSTLIAGPWYAAHPRTWGPTLQRDQQIGGGLMLTIAELVGLPFLAAVFIQWWRVERLRTAELDARLDRELTPVAGPAPVPAGAATAAGAAARSATTQTDATAAPRSPGAPGATTPATGAAAAPEADAGAPVARPAERVRPWWETEQGEIADRVRRNTRR